MYTDGFGVAVPVALLALLAPGRWPGWWLVADLGERANGASPTMHREDSGSEFRRAA